MNFSISKETLQKALRMVSGVVERRQQQNPVLANVLLSVIGTNLEIVATDQEIELIATTKVAATTMPGRALVSCHKLNDICRVLPDEVMVTIESSGDKLLIKAGRSKFSLSTMASNQFPKANALAEQQILRIPRTAFIRLIDKTAFAMADADVRYYLNGMLLEVGSDYLRTVAADGHRLALQTMPFNGPEVISNKIIIPRKSVLEILRILNSSNADSVAIVFGGSHLQVVCDDICLTTVLVSGQYPDYEKTIPKRSDKVALSTRGELKAAITRASALLNDKFHGIQLKFGNGALQISSFNTEKDEAEENLMVNFASSAIELGFNARYLLDFLDAATGETVKMTFCEPNGSALLETEEDPNNLCLVMPMRN